jgi:flavin-dependent dehydrogenase
VDCDVIVIGGGPAGSAAAAFLARSRRSVVVLERDTLPRFHIGESLLASVNDVFDAIGASELIRQAGFPEKWGATFMTPDGRVERFADFAISSEVPSPQTWQVPRAQFDEMLLRHAAACGADVRERHRVVDIAFDREGVTVTYRVGGDGRDEDGSRGSAHPSAARSAAASATGTVRGRMLVDASGRASLLGRRFNLRVAEPGLANVAVFSHYAGVPRGEGRRAGDIRIVARSDGGWFWLIPISGELMSVGAVLPQKAFLTQPRIDHGDLLQRLIADTPAVASLMVHAERRWPVRVERDFSYASKCYAGDRWITVGDAGSFLDPVFSSGVAIALESGLEGARAIEHGLTCGDLSARAFRVFDQRQRARYRSFRRFVTAFYTPAFRDLFFSADPPQRMFRAIITVLAGYWRPSFVSRVWLRLFFLSVRMQERFGFERSHLDQGHDRGGHDREGHENGREGHEGEGRKYAGTA